MKASKAYLEKNKISTEHPDFVAIASMLKNNTGYMYAFTLFRFEQQIDLPLLNRLFSDLLINRNILNTLPKPVANYRSYAELRMNILDAQRGAAVNQFVQLCNSDTKKMMRDNKERWSEIIDDANIFIKFNEEQKKIFTRTISRYKQFNHIKTSLKNYNQFVREGKDFTVRISDAARTKRAHIRVIDPENNVVIVRCASRNAIVALGKGTQWCISDPRETYWSSYVRNREDQQYVLYDFNYASSHKNHIIGVSVQDGRITHAHTNGNDPIDMTTHINNTPYLNIDWFKQGDGESYTEDLLDQRGNSLRAEDLTQIVGWGHLDKALFGLKMNANKAAKTFGPMLRESGDALSDEAFNRSIVLIYKMIESTKFFNEFVPVLHRIEAGTFNYLVKQGLKLKYGVHLETILDTYFKHSEIVTRTQIKEIGGIKYRETITLEPLMHLSVEALDLLLQNAEEGVVTNKALKAALTFKNVKLFETLLKHFKGKVQKFDAYPREYRDLIGIHIATQ